MAYPITKDNIPASQPHNFLSILAGIGHTAWHNVKATAINAIQNYIGIQNSTDNSTIDYMVREGWINEMNICTYLGITSFSIACTQAYFNSFYTIGRVIRFNQTLSGSIQSTSYNSGTHIGTVTMDGSVVINPLTSVDLSNQPNGYTVWGNKNVSLVNPNTATISGLTQSNISNTAGITPIQLGSNPYRCLVYASGAQNIANNPPGNKITFDQVTSDPNSNWSAVNYRYTAPLTGLYDVTLHVDFAGNATGERDVYIYKNNTAPVVQSNCPNNGTNVVSAVVNKKIPLTAGDYIEGWAQQTSGGSLALFNGSIFTYMDIYYLSS